ncbi:MAG: hypothetical protein SFZ24_11695 [Planctomycetota bacterium]|nr:hypothetical protein [Planctomycetota bacterium]
MEVYVFQAALYCEDCGQAIADELIARGVADPGDSDAFPQGPYPEGGGEADVPQHCDVAGHCLNAVRSGEHAVGAFLENPLTGDGRRYLAEAIATRPDSEVVRLWAEFYGEGLGEDDEDG